MTCVQASMNARRVVVCVWGGGGFTFHPIIDKEGMVHCEGPALTHLDLHMPAPTCKSYDTFTESLASRVLVPTCTFSKKH